MAKKELSVTSQFKNFKDFCKKMRIISDTLIKLPNNLVILIHNKNTEDALPTENFAVWKDNDSGQFYNWVTVDPKHFITVMNNENVKIKGTNLIDCDNIINIFKDGIKVYELKKLSGEYNSRLSHSINLYKKMGEFIWNYSAYDFKRISSDDIGMMLEGSPILVRLDGKNSITLAKSLFPLLKKSETPVSFAVVEYDNINSKIFTLFKEEYDDYDLYTLIACLDI